MTAAAALKRIAAANRQLDRAIESLAAFDPVPDYTEAIAAAAHALDGLLLSEIPAAERPRLAEQTRLLAARADQAESLFQTAGTLYLGSLLSHNPVETGYSPYGAPDSFSGSGFHIDA